MSGKYIETNIHKFRNITLYHGTCIYNASNIINNGWCPGSGGVGSNLGNPNYLYLSTHIEDALWFAQEKGCDTIIEVSNIPIESLRPDPEDESGYTMEELLSRTDFPSKYILTKCLTKKHFKILYK